MVASSGIARSDGACWVQAYTFAYELDTRRDRTQGASPPSANDRFQRRNLSVRLTGIGRKRPFPAWWWSALSDGRRRSV